MSNTVAKYQKYAKYKDSGTDWLGEIPTHWDVQPTKRFFRLIAEPAPENNDYELLSVYTEIGVKPRKELEQKGNKASTTDGYWLVKKGDIVVNKLLAWMGAVGYSEYDGVTSPAYDILRPTKKLNPKFYHYLFRTKIANMEFKRWSRGIMEMRLRLYFDELGRIAMPFPTYEEQNEIVDFLDHETTKIYSLIEKQQKLIELLKEKRQAVISHAVTKGLNPDVPMKDSGVEWLGQVPEHWTVAKIKHLSKIISKGTTPTTMGGEFVTEGVRFLKAENIGKSPTVNPFPEFYITENVDAQLSRSRLEENDVLVIIAGATTGLSSVLQKDLLPANTNQAVSFIRPKETAYAKWVAYWLSTQFAQSLIWMGAVQAAQPNLSMENLGNINITLPSVEEIDQLLIVVDKKLSQIDKLIQRNIKAIELIKERRTALISSAVTGKINVTNWQHPNEAKTELSS